MAKGISSLILRERRNDSNRLSFNLARDTRNTRTWVLSENTRTTVPLSFRLVERATLSDCRSKATPCTRCVFSISKGGRYLHDVVQSGNELPGPISRYVSGTFNRLTTHYHTSATLGIFQLTRRGVSSYSPPGILIVAACSKHSTPIFLASDRKSLDFYRGLSA